MFVFEILMLLLFVNYALSIIFGQSGGMVQVSGSSMQPQFNGDGSEYIIAFNFKQKNGDIVVYGNEYTGQVEIKRLIASPGDTVSYDRLRGRFTVSSKNGDAWLDDGPIIKPSSETVTYQVLSMRESMRSLSLPVVALESDYVVAQIASSEKTDFYTHFDGEYFNIVDYKVPEGRYFVAGDNRESSIDSRYFGPVDASKVIGSCFARYPRGLAILFPFGWGC
ncbi:signal peptidase I [Dechloromonas sp. ZS-1]|uniref:signal peptidase I n=1 Tax=Dechloromonas sp. ZS-1 TaxID=3138067 RepID=UPI0031FBFDE1